MSYIDLDFTIPIALLAGAIVLVVLLRQVTRYGERRAAERTRRLLAAYPLRGEAPSVPGGAGEPADAADDGIEPETDVS